MPNTDNRKPPIKIENGDLVKDTLTQLQGIAIVKLIHVTGCVQFRIQPLIKENGYLQDSKVVDVNRLKLLSKNYYKFKT